MGIRVLLIGLVVALSGCDAGAADPASAESAESVGSAAPSMVPAHAEIACVACHDGADVPGRSLAIATTSGCTASGCHTDGGPAIVRVNATATLPRHPTHPGLPGQARMDCAQCHTHDGGAVALRTDVNGCGLCHADQLDAEPAGECTTCHVSPSQTRMTSQALAVPHAEVPWIEGGCVRCHFSVANTPDVVFSAVGCASCHVEGGPAAAAWPVDPATGVLPTDSIHAGHRRVTCGACHAQPAHRVEGMSSSVGLVCADCHAVSHELPARTVAAGVCVSCHVDTHAPQQALLLGIVPWEPARIEPSVKFAAGITCRACHGVAEVDFEHPDTALAGDADRCVGCHLPEYRTVQEWWIEDGDARIREARAWVRAAQTTGSGFEDSIRVALERLDFVEAAGLVHGPRLADRLLREAVEMVAAAGTTGRAFPDLGLPPREGLCSYCHIDSGRTWSLDDMPADFHRDALARRSSPGG